MNLLITGLLIFSISTTSAFACETNIGKRVYVLLGSSESNLTVYSGRVLLPGKDTSKVEMDGCYPSCFKWVNNCAFLSSRKEAVDLSEKLDQGHTSVLEGVGMAAGALVLLGVIGAFTTKKTPKKEEKYHRSNLDDSTLKSMD